MLTFNSFYLSILLNDSMVYINGSSNENAKNTLVTFSSIKRLTFNYLELYIMNTNYLNIFSIENT